jgi:hypothetical protein
MSLFVGLPPFLTHAHPRDDAQATSEAGVHTVLSNLRRRWLLPIINVFYRCAEKSVQLGASDEPSLAVDLRAHLKSLSVLIVSIDSAHWRAIGTCLFIRACPLLLSVSAHAQAAAYHLAMSTLESACVEELALRGPVAPSPPSLPTSASAAAAPSPSHSAPLSPTLEALVIEVHELLPARLSRRDAFESVPAWLRRALLLVWDMLLSSLRLDPNPESRLRAAEALEKGRSLLDVVQLLARGVAVWGAEPLSFAMWARVLSRNGAWRADGNSGSADGPESLTREPFLLSVDADTAVRIACGMAVDGIGEHMSVGVGERLLSTLVWLQVCRTLPALARSTVSAAGGNAMHHLERLTVQHVAPWLIRHEFAELREKRSALEGMTVRTDVATRSVHARYQVLDAVLEMKIELSEAHPLLAATVVGGQRVAVTEKQWRRWQMQMIALMSARNASFVDVLELWKRNTDKSFEGVEECAICYSVLHPTDSTLPNKPCRTCKHAFHAGCLVREGREAVYCLV